MTTAVFVSRMVKVSTPTGIGILAEVADPVYSVAPPVFLIVTPGLLTTVHDTVKLQVDTPAGMAQGVYPPTDPEGTLHAPVM